MEKSVTKEIISEQPPSTSFSNSKKASDNIFIGDFEISKSTLLAAFIISNIFFIEFIFNNILGFIAYISMVYYVWHNTQSIFTKLGDHTTAYFFRFIKYAFPLFAANSIIISLIDWTKLSIQSGIELVLNILSELVLGSSYNSWEHTQELSNLAIVGILGLLICILAVWLSGFRLMYASFRHGYRAKALAISMIIIIPISMITFTGGIISDDISDSWFGNLLLTIPYFLLYQFTTKS